MRKIYVEENFRNSHVGRIPMDWECVRIDKISDVNPKPIKLESNETEVSFIGMADVSESAKLMNSSNALYGEVKKGFTSFRDKDVLVAKITPCFENGKGALVSNLANGVGFGSTEFHVIRAKQGICCPEFIHQITTSHNFRAKGKMNMTGTAGQKRVGKSFISSYLIACPPFEEQQKIAEVLSTVDQRIDLIDQKIAETQKFKTGLVQKLFSKGVGVQGQDGNWQPHTEFKDNKYGMIPQKWNSPMLKNVTDYVDYRGKTPPKVDQGTYLITAKNIKSGHIDYEVSKEYIPTALYDSVMSRGTPEIGDVLFTTEAPLGNVALVDRSDVAIAQRVIKFNPKNSRCLDSRYLKHFLLTPAFQKELMQNATGSTVLGIKGKRLHTMSITLPEITEQLLIADILDAADSKTILLLEQKLENQKLKKGLMQKLLTGEWRVPLDSE